MSNNITSMVINPVAIAVARAIIASQGTTSIGGGGGGSLTVPDAPTIGVATAGNATISIAFTAPSNNGGSAIISYTATLSTGQTQTGSTTPINFTGLSNGVARTATVTATNAIGTSLPSGASNSVTPAAITGVPDAPTIGTATVGNSSMTIPYTAPSNAGSSAIISYTMTLSTGETLTGTQNPFVFSQIDSTFSRTATVTATNTQGTSVASAASNSIKPTDLLSAFTFAGESNTLIAAKTATGSTPNSRRQYTFDRMIKRLKTAGIFTKLTGLWVAGETSASSLINIVNPSVKDLVVNGTPTFTPNVGWTFNAITDFLDTGIALNTTSVNDFSMGYFGKSASTTSFDMGVQATGGNVYLKNNTCQAALNGAAINPLGASSTWWDGVGMTAISRTASTGFSGYHCGIAVTPTTDASTAPTSTLSITIGKINGQTSAYSRRVIQAAFVGTGLIASEIEQLHAIVQSTLNNVEYGDLDIREAAYAPSYPNKYDVIVYGATFAAVTAAHRLSALGRTVAIVGGWRERSVGGMTTSGLGFADYDVGNAIGGLANDVVISARALDGSSATRTAVVGNGTAQLNAQPRSFKLSMQKLLDSTKTNGQTIPIFWSNGVNTAAKTGTKITSFTTVDGRTFVADYFLDTSEELDLISAAGISTTLGREVSGSGSEVLNGYRDTDRTSGSNTVQIEDGSGVRLGVNDAYNTIGNAGSGLIYGISARPATALGAADGSVMSYTFRQTWNNNAARRIPFANTAPAGYTAAKYELLARYFVLFPTASLASIVKTSTLPNTTFDVNNNGGISFNLVGSGIDYAACESAGTRTQIYAARETVQKDIESWVRGLPYWILNSGDSRIPSAVITSLTAYGWDSRHYLDPHPNDTLYWPSRLYVREHRRLVGDYIVNATDATQADGTTPRSTKTISTISYRFDSHPHRRFVDSTGGTPSIFSEGSIGLTQAALGGSVNGTDGITPVPYEAYLPKVAECTNAAVTFGISASHIAMSAGRMELTTAQAGESLAFAINLAITNAKQNLQSVDYPTLRTAILATPTASAPVLPQIN